MCTDNLPQSLVGFVCSKTGQLSPLSVLFEHGVYIACVAPSLSRGTINKHVCAGSIIIYLFYTRDVKTQCGLAN